MFLQLRYLKLWKRGHRVFFFSHFGGVVNPNYVGKLYPNWWYRIFVKGTFFLVLLPLHSALRKLKAMKKLWQTEIRYTKQRELVQLLTNTIPTLATHQSKVQQEKCIRLKHRDLEQKKTTWNHNYIWEAKKGTWEANAKSS